MDKSGEEVYKMLNYPNEDVRQAAVGAMAQFVISLSKSSAPEAAEGELDLIRKALILPQRPLYDKFMIYGAEDRGVAYKDIQNY